MAKITGGNRFEALLRDIDERTVRNVGAALFAAGQEVEVEAQISLSTGSASGDSGGKHQHQPSAPGTPPNTLTKHLADSIQTLHAEPLLVKVIADAEYAAIQEYGGTINHPGGTPFFMKDGEPVYVSKDNPIAARLPKTKPHTITLPERPYMRPALASKRQRIRELIKAGIRSAIKGTA